MGIIQKLDYLLVTIELCDGVLEGIWKKCSRIVISFSVRSEVISERDFDVIIANAKEKEYINIENDKLILQSKGKSYIDLKRSTLIFYDDIEAIFNRLKSYNEEMIRDYCKKLEKTIELILTHNSSRLGEPNWPILTNIVRGSYNKNYFKYSLVNNQYINKIDFQSRYDLIKPIRDFLFKQNINSLNKLGDSYATFITNRKLSSEDLNKIRELGFNVLDDSNVNNPQINLEKHFLSQAINQHLKDKKLIQLKDRFIDFSKRNVIKVEAGGLAFEMDLYFGFKYEILNISHIEFIIAVDPTYVQFINLRTLMEIKNIQNHEEFLEKYSNNKSITTLPLKRPGILEDINLDIKTDQISYWEKKYNYNIRHQNGIAKIRFKGNEDIYTYPLETVAFNKSRIEKELGYLSYSSEILNPSMRKNKIEEYLKAYFKDITSPFYEIDFDTHMLYLNELKDDFIEEYHFLLPPYLIFSQNNPVELIHYEPNKIFEFGGYAGKKTIKISKFIYPKSIIKLDIQNFFKNLKNGYNRYFGKLEYDLTKILDTLDFGETNRNIITLREEINNKIKLFDPREDTMAIVLNPNKKLKSYYLIKEAIINYWKIPDQHLQFSLFQDISEDNYAKIRGFALQLYIKSLRKKGAPWILAYPSDGEGKTIYCGIGFSMEEERKEVGFLATGDSFGKSFLQESLKLSNYTNYFTKELINKIFNYLRNVIDQININRIVLYKRGIITHIEKNIINSFLKELFETDFWKSKKVDVISVEEKIIRLFSVQNKNVENVDRGIIMIINSNESIICTSGTFNISMPERSKKLIKINAEIISSDKNIYDITKEYYDRTFLNWDAPMNPSKYPLELMLSNKLAKLLKEIDLKSEIKYLVV